MNERKSQFKGVSVHKFAHGKDRRACSVLFFAGTFSLVSLVKGKFTTLKKSLFKNINSFSCSHSRGLDIYIYIKSLAEGLILTLYLIHLIEAFKFDIRNSQPFFKVGGGRTGFGIQNHIKVCLCHELKLFIICTAGDFSYSFHTNAAENVIQLTVLYKRGKVSQQVYAGGTLLSFLQKRVERLPDMHHGRPSAFSCKSIHVAWANRKTDSFLSPSAHSFHICSEQCIHAGNAYHHHRRLLSGATFVFTNNTVHCIGDLFKMLSGNNVRFIHV